ncbi:hypothetical protein D3C80_1954420 [compost metagenome]
MPVRGQGTLQFQIKPLAAYQAGGFITGHFRAARLIVGDAGAVLLINLEHGQAGVQGTVEVLALDAEFVVFTHDRVKHLAGNVL